MSKVEIMGKIIKKAYKESINPIGPSEESDKKLKKWIYESVGCLESSEWCKQELFWVK